MRKKPTNHISKIFKEPLIILKKFKSKQHSYSLDYFDAGIIHSKEIPSSLSFSIALLHEILCNLKPSHQLFDKIKYATFLLNLAAKNIEFSLLYDLYHQVKLKHSITFI